MCVREIENKENGREEARAHGKVGDNERRSQAMSESFYLTMTIKKIRTTTQKKTTKSNKASRRH